MEFSFIQKFGAALLAAAWLLWGSNMIGDWLIPERAAPHGGSEAVATAATAAAGGAKPAEVQVADIKPLLAKASIDKGKELFRRCEVCHTAAKGAGAKVGPNLWDVVGRPKASFDHFNYSDAMKKKGGKWTYDELNHFIAGPQKYIPGTKMTFAGLPNTDERADVIAYLRTLNDSPPPLPTVATAKTEAASTAPKPQAAPAKDLKTLLANANLAEGKRLFRQCKICHTATKGAGAKIGPNLWNVVGRPRASFDHFDYSEAMKKKGGKWTYEELFRFLAGPQKYIPGIKMTFPGLPKADQRADVIAYLRTLNDSPPPLP